MELPEGQADHFAELLLGQAAHHPALTDAHGDTPIGGAGTRSTHVRVLLSLLEQQAPDRRQAGHAQAAWPVGAAPYLPVEPAMHRPAGLECHEMLLRNADAYSSDRVATSASAYPLGREHAEAAQFHPTTARQRGGNLAEHRRNNDFGLALNKMWIALGQICNKIGFFHRGAILPTR